MAYPAELDAWLRKNTPENAALTKCLPACTPGSRSPATRILLVDDERPIADMLHVILHQAGFEVSVAYDGLAAVTVAQSFRPDIVIADYHMPNLNGIEACIQIKRMLPASRIIMLSGHSLSEEFAPYQTNGFDFLLLSKPMHPGDLLQALASEKIQPSGTGKRLRILNVNDVEAHRYSLTRLFKHAGFDVIEAGTGSDALHSAFEYKPDLILLDIHLPDRDGYDVCATLKKNPETAQITIMHVTSSAIDPESALLSAKAGADAYIHYPIKPSRLVERTRELLQIRYLKEQAA